MFNWKHEAQDRLEALLFDHVDDRAFPCVGAKSAMARGTLDVLACSSIDSALISERPGRNSTER